MSSFCQEALAVANSIIHPRSVPQVCSAPGPLLLGTSEYHSSNGPLSVDHESISESLSSNRENQMTIGENVLSQQSTLFESNNLNGIACSQTEQVSVEHRDYVETTEGRNAVSKSFTNVGNTPMEGIEHETSGEQNEQFNTSGKDNNSQKEKSHREAVNPNSEISGTRLVTSSGNTVRVQLPNQEKCINNTNQMSTSENLPIKAVVSPQQHEKLHDSINPLGMSEPKRRRIEDDDPNTDKETQVESNQVSFKPNKDQLTETIAENETVTNEVSKTFFFHPNTFGCLFQQSLEKPG